MLAGNKLYISQSSRKKNGKLQQGHWEKLNEVTTYKQWEGLKEIKKEHWNTPSKKNEELELK